MITQLKPRKCKMCKAEYDPKAEWQKFCSGRCRTTAANHKKADILRRAQRIIEQHEKGAA